LQGLDCFSLPTVYRESKGISVLEALANAVPVVLPAHGTFPEVIELTGGGVLHNPETPQDLAAALLGLMTDRQKATQLGLAGQRFVRREHEAAGMAARTLELYRKLGSANANR
jgi:glycosyltransferase involved in cell wall biosynthesis